MEEKFKIVFLDELNVLKPVNNIETSPHTQHTLLANQFSGLYCFQLIQFFIFFSSPSVEYPYALSHEEENLPTTKLIHTKSIESEVLINEKSVDTSTFVLKRKEQRRKTAVQSTNENTLNGVVCGDFAHQKKNIK